MQEYLSHKLNKLRSNSIIKSWYFVLTKIIYTLENKNSNGSTIVS
jgi:hypothetical protein